MSYLRSTRSCYSFNDCNMNRGAEVVENAISVTENVAKFPSNLLTLDSGTLIGLRREISVNVNDD